MDLYFVLQSVFRIFAKRIRQSYDMTYKITAPQTLRATIKLPASKSISNRALIISALAGGDILPENLSDCDDTEVMVKALRSLSPATPLPSPRFPRGRPPKGEGASSSLWERLRGVSIPTIDIGAAGTAMRFLTAYFAVTPSDVVLTGTERMKQRPIGILVDALRYLGADIEYLESEGVPPLHIRGRRLDGGHIDVDARVSSQFISALLMIGPVLKRGLDLRMTGSVSSRPYIDLTLNVMHSYGAQAEWSDVDTITVSPKAYEKRPYVVESDWSSASYWYEALSLCNDYEATVSLSGLKDSSRQGDSVVRYIFSALGVKTQFRKDGTVRLTRHVRTLPRMDYDFKNSPDLAQTLVATCCALSLPFHFKGLASLHIKETDRIEALRREMLKLGIELAVGSDEISCDGFPSGESGAVTVSTYNDHRMALSFAPMAMNCGSISIDNPEVVSKSYPNFWKDLRSAGFTVSEQNN